MLINNLKILLPLATLILLTSCGELSYKRGASATDLEKTKLACQSKGSDVAIEKCLEENGWTIQKLDSMDMFAEISVTPDNRRGEESKVLAPSSVDGVKSDTDVMQNNNLGNNNPAVTDKKSSVANSSEQPNNINVTPIKPKQTQFNPLDTFVVNSWWKTGVNGDAFRTDSNLCIAKLGEAHKPDAKTQTVTAGFVMCMHEQGWKAIKKIQ
ncbi:MAG: hypothetical protein H7Z70_00530 [Bacteroidia bacterium]|nr:hypothetical protein [Methylotenera sp.]